jgi:hypothetical protein
MALAKWLAEVEGSQKQAAYNGCSYVSSDPTYFFADPDGWITSATVEWSAGGGGGGTIDLLTNSEDVRHFVNDKLFLKNVVTGEISEIFMSGIYGQGETYASGVVTPALGDHIRAGESNPSNVYGVFVTRGRAQGCFLQDELSGPVDGPISLTIKLTDNDGKNFSKNYVINDAGISVSDESNGFPLKSGIYKSTDISGVYLAYDVDLGNIISTKIYGISDQLDCVELIEMNQFTYLGNDIVEYKYTDDTDYTQTFTISEDEAISVIKQYAESYNSSITPIESLLPLCAL